MDAENILLKYELFQERKLSTRFFKYTDVVYLIGRLPIDFTVKIIGKSYEGRNIHLIKFGNGDLKIFLWSQMHGDEATGTMALFDLCNFLKHNEFSETNEFIKNNCTLYMMPMVNPDGAARFSRRNAQQIDVNRDYHKTVSPEAALLKKMSTEINPDFGFNLHDQSNLWSVKKTGNPATLSFLAPAFDEALSINEVRKNAMQVIADVYRILNPFLPLQIGLFDDEYEPRAFGDNFQANGISTILIEAGGLLDDDEKQKIRKYFFLSILSGLVSINLKKYLKQSLKNYLSIPKNNKEIFHILIKDVLLDVTRVSLGISYNEEPEEDGYSTKKCYILKDIGDLTGLGAYHYYEGNNLKIKGKPEIYKNANFSLLNDDKLVLSFKNGILQSIK